MVKEGYKETEIGVFPIDWNIKRIKDIATPKARIGWQNLRKEEYLKNGDYLLITGTDFLDGKVILDKCCYVSKERYTQDHNIQVSNGAILITKDGTLGKVAFVEGLTKPATLNAGVFVLNNLDTCVSNYYLYQYLRTDALLEYALKTSTGGTIQHLNQNVLINFCIPCPTLEEQQKIAEALSDMDNLIAALEKLIEKKKTIKQGAMQELLTGKKRLPEFSGEWIAKKIKDIADVGRGRVISQVEITRNIGGRYPVYSSQTSNDGIMGYLQTFDFEGEYITWTTDGVNAGTVFYRSGKFNCTNVCGTLKCKKDNTAFVARRLGVETPNYVATNLANPKLMNDVMKNIIVTLPPTFEEQTAIATILSNMDNEITALEQKLAKCQKLKQGMMQQLLTGKIRLVSNDDEVTDKPEVETLKVSTKGHNHQFDDAVVIAGIVDEFYSDKYPLGRKKVQKLLYLFRRHQEADTSAFKKKAAGPYADEVRYKGGEPIAISSKYISVKRGNKGSSFSKGEKIADALTYLENWNLNDDLKWLCEQFKYIKTDRLELLATIDMAMCDLEDAGITVTVDSIKELIKSHSEWRAKLSKGYFKDNDIAWAIKECKKLFN